MGEGSAGEPRRALGSQTTPSPTGKVVCEEPNSRMHHFVGCLEWDGKKYPLDSGHILLRGCKIRNTDTCYGMVLYAGTAAGACRAGPGGCPAQGFGGPWVLTLETGLLSQRPSVAGEDK